MGTVAAAADKKLKHRKFHWCRQANDFIDMPLWRLVAETLHMPLHQVQAFALRLESLANRSTPRGYVGDFRPAEFGVALGMPKEDAARIYAAMEGDEVGWIAQDHLATFWERNPDTEDEGATERKQRERSFKVALKELANLAGRGYVDAAARTEAERSIAVLRDQARRGQLPLQEQRRQIADLLRGALSTVTRSQRDQIASQRDQIASQRDIVTVTTEQIKNSDAAAVDNCGAGARRDPAGSPKGEGVAAACGKTPEEWVGSQGLGIVADRMQLLPSLAETRIERWKRELGGDCLALAGIIDAADQANLRDAAFHVSVTDQISRRRRDAAGPQLPLVRVIHEKKQGGAA